MILHLLNAKAAKLCFQVEGVPAVKKKKVEGVPNLLNDTHTTFNAKHVLQLNSP